MKIATLGTGAMTAALCPHWAAAGHDILVAGRSRDRADALAARIGARSVDLDQAARDADVVLLAVLWQGVDWTLRAAGAGSRALTGKVLIDCTNPVEVEHFTLTSEPGTSVAERVARMSQARVVKAFNLCHADVCRAGPGSQRP